MLIGARCDRSGEEVLTLRERRRRGEGWWECACLQSTMHAWMTGDSSKGGAIVEATAALALVVMSSKLFIRDSPPADD